MSERDPRAELAGVAASLRRYLEREAAAGLGDLVVRGATRGRGLAGAPSAATRRATAAPPPPANAMAPGEPSTSRAHGDAAHAATPPASAAPAATLESVDASPPAAAVSLFDEAPRKTFEFQYELPPVHPPLASRDLEDRERIHAASLPVLDEIAGLTRACRQCGLCDTRRNAVPGVGSARTGIVFVGEAPGADEDAKGEPFVGRAGQLLTQIIQGMDDRKLIPGVPLNRDTVYICNVLKCRPPENRNPLPHEIERCSPYLLRQLEAIQPRIICCLGKFAAELLVGVKGTIAGLRGKVYRYQGAKLIVTYHPAACLRNPGYKKPVWEDMQLLAREYLA